MNLAFSDINMAFSNLVQAEALPSGIGTFGGSENRNSLFADNLNQVLKDAKTAKTAASDKSAAAGTIVSGKKESLEKAKTLFLDEVDKEQGLPFLSKLQNLFLTLSDGDLNNITLDAKGLEALKKMLLKAGFEPGEVEELISGLSEKAEGKAISLKTVMDSLFKLSVDNEDEIVDEEALIETSGLPFIVSILNSLGLPKEKVDQIVTQADRGQKGISLDVVIDHLKAIEAQSLGTGTGQSFHTQEGDTSFSMLFEQLGLALPENTAGQLGLGDFLVSLEARKEKLIDTRKQAEAITGKGDASSPVGKIKESSDTLVDSLFKHLEIRSAKIGAAEFSQEQIKNQFETDLLIPDKNKPNKNMLFAQDQSGSTVKSESFFKELESSLWGKSEASVNSGSRFKDGEDIIRSAKSDSAKTGESLQVSASDVKTDLLGSAMKAKETFRSMPTYVMHQVEKSIVRAINQGENTVRIQLKPAELGRLVMTIDNVGNSMKVSIITENQAAKEILASHVNELKTVLAAAGISLDKFDVEMNSNFKQSMADTNNEFNNSNRKNRNKRKNGIDSIDAQGRNAGSSAAAIQDGSYHFVA